MAMEQALATGLHRMMHCTQLAELASGAKDPQVAHFLSGHGENEARSLRLRREPPCVAAPSRATVHKSRLRVGLRACLPELRRTR